MDEFGAEVLIDLIPQSAYPHFNNVRVRVKIIVPDMLHYHGLGYHIPGIAHEIFKQGELQGLEIYLLLTAHDISGDEVHGEVFDLELVRFCYASGPADQCLDAGQEFRKGERLGQVIISACLEALYPVIHRTFRTQDEDRDVDPVPAHFLDKAQPIEPGQHDIDDGGIVGFNKRPMEPCLTIRDMINGKACLEQGKVSEERDYFYYYGPRH